MARNSEAESVSLASERVHRWLKYPVTFINTSDPYADMPSPDSEEMLPMNEISSDVHRRHDWEFERRPKTSSTDCYRLEALSTAALYSTPEANDIPQTASVARLDFQSPTQPRTPSRDAMGPPMSPPLSMASSSNNLNFLLNPTSQSSPTIDPSLHGPYSTGGQSFSNVSGNSPRTLQDTQHEVATETIHEVAFLLRYFSETPGQWCVYQQL